MTEKDNIFKFYTVEEVNNIDQSDFSHFGWEKGAYSFFSLAESYKNGADAIYEKIVASRGDNAIIDTLIYPLSFMHRHAMEIFLKFLYIKYSDCNEDELKKVLNANHNLVDTWYSVKLTLSAGKKRVGSKVSIGAIEHYIKEMDRFDPMSMRMRYPVDKKLQPHNNNSRFDYHNFHKCMTDFHNEIRHIDYDIDGQINELAPLCKIEEYTQKYNLAKQRVLDFISNINKIPQEDDSEMKITTFLYEISEVDRVKRNFLGNLTSDEKIIFETLFYAGRAVSSNEVRLSLNPKDRVAEFITICIEQMESDRVEFGKEVTNADFNIYGKQSLSIVACLQKAIDILG